MKKHQPAITREVLERAMTAARRTNSEHMGTEHILLGICTAGRSSAKAILTQHGITDTVLMTRLVRGNDTPSPNQLPYSRNAEAVLAAAEANSNGTVGTWNILLAILDHPGCTAARLIELMGVRLDDVRRSIRARHPERLEPVLKLHTRPA